MRRLCWLNRDEYVAKGDGVKGVFMFLTSSLRSWNSGVFQDNKGTTVKGLSQTPVEFTREYAHRFESPLPTQGTYKHVNMYVDISAVSCCRGCKG